MWFQMRRQKAPGPPGRSDFPRGWRPVGAGRLRLPLREREDVKGWFLGPEGRNDGGEKWLISGG